MNGCEGAQSEERMLTGDKRASSNLGGAVKRSEGEETLLDAKGDDVM